MKEFLKGFLLLVLLASIAGCSRKKNNFLNRNWHAVTAEYNTLYNGNLALELGKEALNEAYLDDYWNILPVERMQVSDRVLAPGENVNPNFAVAEQKAVRAIQRHSMLLEGSEKNPQIDEAYLLLGKARYFDQRFVPALEAFNYILHKYPLSNTINEARIWREKTNMRLEFDELAIKNLKKVLESENLEKQNRAEASAMLAQAYLNTNSPDSALTRIKTAAELTGNKNEEGRYWFIAGQLHDFLGEKDSANLAFDQVIDLNRKTPRIYRVNAFIRQIQNMEITSGDKAEALERLTDLAKDRENRPYLDKIYFQLAEFHYQQDSVGLAVDYYNRSLRVPSDNLYLQSLDYETLGNINFDAANFEVAGAYYDSTLSKLAQNTRDYRLIKKKRDNLDDVIYYENLANKNDSILYIANLSEAEQLEYFTTYTTALKEKATSEAGQPAQQQAAQNFFEDKRRSTPGVPTPGGGFYFYNPTIVAYGKQEFFRTWGDRELADNWRTSQRSSSGGGNLNTEGINEVVAMDPKFDVQFYLEKIPRDPALLDSLKQELNFANYQLGLIYREKFNENKLAAQKLEFLLSNDPQERLILPAKYHLYKNYSELGALVEAEALKNDIIYQYPDSRYAAIIQNPGSLLEDENNPRAQYQELYTAYEQQNYDKVISESERLIQELSGDEIIPKFELLKAMAEGRLKGFEAYKEGLNYVALNYPQSEEGKKAQELMSKAIPGLAKKEFLQDTIANSFKLIFSFEKTNSGEAATFRRKIEGIIQELNYGEMEVSLDVYDQNRDFVVVHGFPSAGNAAGFAEKILTDNKYRIDKKSFYISTPNYRIAQIHKNIDTYLESLNQTPQ